MVIGHLSDLHVRDDSDVIALERQLDRIAERRPDHLAVTGDLLDRWDQRLLERVLDAFDRIGYLDAERLTILHGNHDLASSGGHPRRRADLVRLVARFWDPPPLLAARRNRFYAAIARRGSAIGSPAPHLKTLASGLRIAVLDTVPFPWRPLRISSGGISVQHAVGCMSAAQSQWLESLRGTPPLVVLLHHYPLAAPQFQWQAQGILGRVIGDINVPMAIPPAERERFWTAAGRAGVRLVLCGHVHRARLEWADGVAVGLNGQSGAAWAGRTIAFYEVTDESVVMTTSGG